MALNLTIFRTRALTALIFTLLMLTGLLWNQWSFFVLFSIIHFGCWYEYQRLISLIDPDYAHITVYHKYGVAIAGWCIMLYCSTDTFQTGRISLHQIGLWGGLFFMFLLPVLEAVLVRQISFKNLGYSALGLLYISLSLGLLTNLRGFFYGQAVDILSKVLVLRIIASLWINDTAAYLAGSFFGKTPLTPISPSKTWEGTVGGILMAILVMGAIGYFASSELDWGTIAQWMIIAAIASILGTCGDLLESKLKRAAQVKDSGHILPGHGGFLDRFDSLLLAAPSVWLYEVLVLK